MGSVPHFVRRLCQVRARPDPFRSLVLMHGHLTMPVPSFDQFWLPFLRVLEEQGRTTPKEIEAELQARLGLDDEDVREVLPSGR